MKKVYFVFLVLVLLFIAGCGTSGPGRYSNFIDCLSEKGVKVYSSKTCPHCTEQKKLFKDSRDYFINSNVHFECGPLGSFNEVCKTSGIKGVPTWEINGEKYPGVQNLERLSSLSGCSLE